MILYMNTIQKFPLKTKEKHNKGPLRENSSSAFEKMQALTLWSK